RLMTREHTSQKNITAESGQNVTLTCRWSRRDLKAQYVLWYWEKQFVPYYQHPSFKNRVDLQDRQMKDGDVSLILKDVTTADRGTYKCCVVHEVREGRKLAILKTEPISVIHLKVISPGKSVEFILALDTFSYCQSCLAVN
uniref:Ig-like domain-containing protein n=1 Tax=Maylandia zebra TaxID=106582 RepID=A0A3P9C4E8_9CICH